MKSLRVLEIVARAAVGVALLVTAIAWALRAWSSYQSSHPLAPCQEELIEFNSYYKIACSDPRAKLTVPEGWTWAKCVCPEGKP